MEKGVSRRTLLHRTGLAVASLAVMPRGRAAEADVKLLQPGQNTKPDALAADEHFWSRVRSQYWLPDDIVQLENGNWGVMAKPVLEDYERHTFRVNRDSSYYSRREFHRELEIIRARVASMLGVEEGEIAFARGATEVLQSLIGGYRHLRPGDGVMYADVDYDSMQSAMAWLKERRGVKVEYITLPERAAGEELVEVYRAALEHHPHVRLLLLTHLSHRHGLVVPVREIVAMAREYGVDCIVDAAHSWGQMDFTVADLGADFVGFNLHKWMGAPIGVGVMYVRRERLDAIEPFMGDTVFPQDDIRARIHTGTSNYAALLTVPAALDFHQTLGAANKAARLSYLRNYWVSRVRSLGGITVLTADRSGSHAGITSFRLGGETGVEANIALVRRLLQQYGIFTVHRTGLAAGACVRVTPGFFTSAAELDQLVSALGELAH